MAHFATNFWLVLTLASLVAVCARSDDKIWDIVLCFYARHQQFKMSKQKHSSVHQHCMRMRLATVICSEREHAVSTYLFSRRPHL